ncbi:MAG: GNAT family N-acetyltransferase [Thermomicrobiales bacterium]|nr:GNAT family N-acetyltransferase [Thermomicrobiales bacterium]
MPRYTVREITPDDLPAWWELRLMALQDSPDAFGADYATHKDKDPFPFYLDRGYLAGGPNTLFAAFDEQGQIVAQTGCFADTGKRSHIAMVISVYTHPEHRGHGLAQQLVAAAIHHLQRFLEITSIRISVNSNNQPARHIYEKLGFVTWGEEPDAIRAADGSCHNECHMVLRAGESVT